MNAFFVEFIFKFTEKSRKVHIHLMCHVISTFFLRLKAEIASDMCLYTLYSGLPAAPL